MAVYDLPERAETAGTEVHDAGGALDEALAEAARVAVAVELRRLAEYYLQESARERQRSRRLANGAPKWQHESSIASYQELRAVAGRLTARADELDPEGAR